MGRYIIRRFLWMILVLFVVSAITFLLMHAIPGGPFDKEKPVSKEVLANLNERYHLDEPLVAQYARYLGDILVPRVSSTEPGTSLLDDALFNIPLGNKTWLKWMNFGPSYTSRSRTVNDIFRDQLPISAQLGTMSLIIAVLIGLPLGILAALKQNTILDYLGMSVAIMGVSVPVIVLGPILVWIFGVSLKWLPPTGWGVKPPFVMGIFPSEISPDFFKYAIMPSFALGFGSSAIIARLTRASLLQVIREDYIRTARAKGLTERRVLYGHVFRNAMLIVIGGFPRALVAILFTSSILIEVIFSLDGLGLLGFEAAINRDYPVMLGSLFVFSLIGLLLHLISDLTYTWVDPRIDFDRREV